MSYIYTTQDAAIEKEIAELQNSPMVQLAIKYEMIRSHRIRRLQELRDLEAKGKDLSEAGVTLEDLNYENY